jgi:hypothetical protein
MLVDWLDNYAVGEERLINNRFVSVKKSMTVLGRLSVFTYFFYIGEGFLLEEIKTSCELCMNILYLLELL